MKRSKIVLFSLLPVALIVLDQITKWLTRRHFSKQPDDVALIPKVLYFRYVETAEPRGESCRDGSRFCPCFQSY